MPRLFRPAPTGRRPRRRRHARVGGALVALAALAALAGPGGPSLAPIDPGAALPGRPVAGPAGASTRSPDLVVPAADGARLAQPSRDEDVRPDRASPSPAPRAGVPLTDPYRDQQWHLDRLGLVGGRPVPDGAGQVIAILDSGVDLAHPDLEDALLRDREGRVVGWDLVDDDDVPQDRNGHGTMVAGVAAARTGNGVGVAGVVSGGARLLPVRVLDEQGRGTAGRVAAGVDWAVANGATVLNLSLESAGVAALRDDADLDTAIRRALDAGVVVVVAAGNGDEVADPLARPGLAVVGATDREDRRAVFSDRGRTDLLMAPGVDIVSTWCRADDRPATAACDGQTHTYGIADGTSFAAPQVSGLVAMLASTGLTPLGALQRLAATTVDLGEPGPDAATGRGLVSAAAALGEWPDEPVPATTPREPAPPQPLTAAPTDVAVGREVVGAAPPADRGLDTVTVAVAAIVAAVALVARGLRAATPSPPGAPPRDASGPAPGERVPDRTER